MKDLTTRFSRHLRAASLCEEKDRILVALSGGKDSVCLLFLLREESVSLGFSLVACHVNHGIRGKAADRDEDFCRKLCETWDVPFTARQADVPAFCRETGMGLEEGARAERYRLLREEAAKFSCSKIATAHTASDQAETVLFRLARGAGLAGAAGIAQRDGDLIRPLLPFTAEEVLTLVKENHLPFVEDETNEDLTFARNRIRKEVLPALEEAVPGGAAGLARFARIAARQDAFCQRMCDRLEEALGLKFSQGRAPLDPLCDLARDEAEFALLYEALKRMAGKEKIAMDLGHFEAVLSLLKSGGTGKIIEIKQGYAFCRKKDSLVFQKIQENKQGASFHQTLVTGENFIPGVPGKLSLSSPGPGKVQNIHKNLLIIRAAFDRIEGDLFARNLLPGDRIQMNGMHRSVKKMLCDAGIPREERAYLPLVCDSGGIFWIPGLGLCDRARDKEANLVFTMHWDREESSSSQGR